MLLMTRQNITQIMQNSIAVKSLSNFHEVKNYENKKNHQKTQSEHNRKFTNFF